MNRPLLTMCTILSLVSAVHGIADKQESSQITLAGQDNSVRLPAFDQENAALIDKALSELKISDLVAPAVKKTERSIVVSMEDKLSRSDSNYNYLVEDNLIASLLARGFRVFERDENLIIREIPEGNERYNRSLLRLLPTPPSVALMDSLERNGLSSLLHDEKLTLSEILGFYKQINDDYSALIAAQNHMASAEVIISYRLIELGLRAEMKRFQADAANAGAPQRKVLTWQIDREAIARLFVRVMDAKTGEIRAANILQSRIPDTLQLAQLSGESDSSFDARASNYLSSLSRYNYSWYEQTMPNKSGNTKAQSTPLTIINPAPNAAPPVAAPSAPAPVRETPVKLSIGVSATVAPLEYNNQTVTASGIQTSRDMSWVPVGGKAFFDFTYGEASIGYEVAAANMYSKVTASGSSTVTNPQFSLGSIVIQLLAKYPVTAGSFTIFPMAGIESFICLNGSYARVSFVSSDISDYSPTFLIFGVGADFPISKAVYLRTELTGGYNLTSKRSSSYYAGTAYVSSSGWEVRFSAGVGYTLN